jgi:hypothetical protein
MPNESSTLSEASLSLSKPTCQTTVFVGHHKNGNEMQIASQGICRFLQHGYHTTFVVSWFRTSSCSSTPEINRKVAPCGLHNVKTMVEIH